MNLKRDSFIHRLAFGQHFRDFYNPSSVSFCELVQRSIKGLWLATWIRAEHVLYCFWTWKMGMKKKKCLDDRDAYKEGIPPLAFFVPVELAGMMLLWRNWDSLVNRLVEFLFHFSKFYRGWLTIGIVCTFSIFILLAIIFPILFYLNDHWQEITCSIRTLRSKLKRKFNGLCPRVHIED